MENREAEKVVIEVEKEEEEQLRKQGYCSPAGNAQSY